MAPLERIIIVGAGPAGLLLALMLAREGIRSTVLEAWSHVDQRLRATQYGTPATRVLRKAGVLDDIREQGYRNFPSICWRKSATGEVVAKIDLGITTDSEDRITVIPLAKMLEIILQHVKRLPEGMIDLKFNHRVTDLGQDESKAWVDCELPEEGGKRVRYEGDYIVGCDGGKSTVRKWMFGEHAWPGVTHDHELFACNVREQTNALVQLY